MADTNGNGRNGNGNGSKPNKPWLFSSENQPDYRGHNGRKPGASVRSAMAYLLAQKTAPDRTKADELAALIWELMHDKSIPPRDRIRAAELFRKAVDGDRMIVDTAEQEVDEFIAFERSAWIPAPAASPGSNGDHGRGPGSSRLDGGR